MTRKTNTVSITNMSVIPSEYDTSPTGYPVSNANREGSRFKCFTKWNLELENDYFSGMQLENTNGHQMQQTSVSTPSWDLHMEAVSRPLQKSSDSQNLNPNKISIINSVIPLNMSNQKVSP